MQILKHEQRIGNQSVTESKRLRPERRVMIEISGITHLCRTDNLTGPTRMQTENITASQSRQISHVTGGGSGSPGQFTG